MCVGEAPAEKRYVEGWYIMSYNKENYIDLFSEVNFVIWMNWPCGVLTYRASYAWEYSAVCERKH